MNNILLASSTFNEADYFKTTWDASSGSIAVPVVAGSVYNFEYRIDGGNWVTYSDTPTVNHELVIGGLAGTITLEIRTMNGGFPSFIFGNTGDKDKILSIEQWGNNQWINVAFINAYYGCSNLVINATDAPDLTLVNSLNTTFRGCTSLTTFDAENWITAGIGNLNSLFYQCTNLTTINISSWDVSSVTQLLNTFRNCQSLVSIDLSNWTTTSLTAINNCFNGCLVLTSLDISNWYVEDLTSLQSTFFNCNNINGLNFSGWTTSSLTNCLQTFRGCDNLTSLDLSGWDMSNVTTISSMFNASDNLETIGVSGWTTSSLENINAAFFNCTALSGENVSNWIVSGVTNASGFMGNTSNILTQENYEDTLVNWAAQELSNSETIDFGTYTYATEASVKAKEFLTNVLGTPGTGIYSGRTSPGWTITDGGYNGA